MDYSLPTFMDSELHFSHHWPCQSAINSDQFLNLQADTFRISSFLEEKSSVTCKVCFFSCTLFLANFFYVSSSPVLSKKYCLCFVQLFQLFSVRRLIQAIWSTITRAYFQCHYCIFVAPKSFLYYPYSFKSCSVLFCVQLMISLQLIVFLFFLIVLCLLRIILLAF